MGLEHSKSPWKVLAHNWSDTSICDADGNRIAFQSIECEYGGTETTEENQHEQEIKAMVDAQVIAAAPELLKACEMQLKLIEDMARFVGKMALQDYALFNEAPLAARQAIAKAKGDS